MRPAAGGVTGQSAGEAAPRLPARWTLGLGAIAALGIVASVAASWQGLGAVGASVLRAAWLLPALVALHLGQLFLAGLCWRVLFADAVPGVRLFYRLRIIREGIDSLLPVAQIGGEVVGTRLLARAGVPLSRAAASVIVDVTFELLTQVGFLLTGLGLLAARSGGAWRQWVAALLGGMLVAGILVAVQRFGGLRLLEGLLRGMARRWPALAGASLDGIHAEALGLYRRRRALGRSAVLHYTAWALGSIETWAVLHALSVAVSPAEAVIVESLGMAGRSAGFAIPAALGAQESGFILAGATIGLAAGPTLALSIIKRLREILVGGIGLLLWRWAVQTPARAAVKQP